MIQVHDYSIRNGRMTVREAVVCPDCGAEMVYRDSVKRLVRDAKGRRRVAAGASVPV